MNELAHLVDAFVDLSHITIEVGEPLKPHAQALMDALAVTVIVKQGAPTMPPPSWFDPYDRHRRKELNGP